MVINYCNDIVREHALFRTEEQAFEIIKICKNKSIKIAANLGWIEYSIVEMFDPYIALEDIPVKGVPITLTAEESLELSRLYMSGYASARYQIILRKLK